MRITPIWQKTEYELSSFFLAAFLIFQSTFYGLCALNLLFCSHNPLEVGFRPTKSEDEGHIHEYHREGSKKSRYWMVTIMWSKSHTFCTLITWLWLHLDFYDPASLQAALLYDLSSRKCHCCSFYQSWYVSLAFFSWDTTIGKPSGENWVMKYNLTRTSYNLKGKLFFKYV